MDQEEVEVHKNAKKKKDLGQYPAILSIKYKAGFPLLRNFTYINGRVFFNYLFYVHKINFRQCTKSVRWRKKLHHGHLFPPTLACVQTLSGDYGTPATPPRESLHVGYADASRPYIVCIAGFPLSRNFTYVRTLTGMHFCWVYVCKIKYRQCMKSSYLLKNMR